MNGTMEDPVDKPQPSLQDSCHEKVELEDTANISSIENGNSEETENVISDSSGDPLEIPDPEIENDNCNKTDGDNEVHLDNETKPEGPQDTIKITSITLENHNGNSNESYAESTHSSQAKDDSLDHLKEESVDDENHKSRDDLAKIEKLEGSEEVDSDDDSSDEEESDSFREPKTVHFVSLNSDSDDSHVEEKANNTEFRSKINNQNGNSGDSGSPEVHEIVSDNENDLENDVSVISDEKEKPVDKTTPLRRSSRTIKRMRYEDTVENGESDIEEIPMEDPLKRKSKPIIISNTKSLVDMAVKQMKQGQSQKKGPTMVIIDSNTSNKLQQQSKSAAALAALNLYQSIAARGTTVTPVKSAPASQNSNAQHQQPIILPSLTDDMFVVEAPSFIVPYVYEKPSVKPFREFVDILGRELEEQKAKEEKDKKEKEKEEKEKRAKIKQEKREKGEEVEDSDEESKPAKEAEELKKLEKKDEKKEEKSEKKKDSRRRRKDDDDASWDGSSTDSDDEIASDEEEKTVVIKDKVDAIEEIKDVANLTVDKVCTGKSDNYFDCSLGSFFINIGLNLVQEFVQNDLLKQQQRKLYKEKKGGHSTKSTEVSIASLMKNLEFSKENNAPYAFKQNKCEFCSFKSESELVMKHHMETPHMKNNVYKCNYCAFEIRSPQDILYHMEAEHNVRGKLERAPAYHQCANCPFEDNGKGKLARHLIPCAKKFKPDVNLAPPVEWEPPAKIPKITRSRNNAMNAYHAGSAFSRNVGNNMRPMGMVGLAGAGQNFRARGRAPQAFGPRPGPGALGRGGLVVRPAHTAPNFPIANNGKNMVPKSMHQPSISITPLPRHPPPSLQQQGQSKTTFVICEICDGYIKDLEQLRNHMQWIHKVKIHPKMIYNRPPLNCQKCQFRFFTDQGLERHLLGTHGLVTSSMQEAANKGKDAGRCPVCGRVYQCKLLNHVARDHSLTLKPAHLSYKCTVCTATFGMYKQFENHVYSAHSVVAKRVMDKSKQAAPPPKPNESHKINQSLRINHEITIIPQGVKQAKDK